MATSFNFDGNQISIPGAYSNIDTEISNPTLDLGYGKLLVIDTGSGSTWGGGAGISGTNAKNKDAIYTFTRLQDFRNFAKGGLWWLLANPLFRPAGLGVSGISSITFVRAATTAPATLSYTFTGGGTNGGTFEVETVDEGEVANGQTTSNDNLYKGYGAIMKQGVIDTSKFFIEFFVGSWRGSDTYNGNRNYAGISQDGSVPRLIAQSPEFSNIETLIDWAENDFTFNQFFRVTNNTQVSGDGSVDSVDLSNNSSIVLASGGTETYTSSEVDTVLDNLQDFVCDFILADKFGDNAQVTENSKIASWIANEAKVKPDLYIGGGIDESKFADGATNGSIEIAQNYDSQYITVVHGGPKIASRTGTGFRTYPAIYKAAAVLGREAGQEPQVPTTFKPIAIDGEQHKLKEKEIKSGLSNGVLMTRQDGGAIRVIKGVNSLQNNDFLVNNDGTTYSKQLRRIARQLNKEIEQNAKNQLLYTEDGVNRNTLSPQDVKEFVKGYLQSQVATDSVDNLILSFQNINVEVVGDSYQVTYEFEPNFEVSFMFFTGLILSP